MDRWICPPQIQCSFLLSKIILFFFVASGHQLMSLWSQNNMQWWVTASPEMPMHILLVRHDHFPPSVGLKTILCWVFFLLTSPTFIFTLFQTLSLSMCCLSVCFPPLANMTTSKTHCLFSMSALMRLPSRLCGHLMPPIIENTMKKNTPVSS